MDEKKDKRISVPVTPSELAKITEKAQQANMSRSNYIRTSVLSDEKMIVIDNSATIIEHLGNICSEIQDIKYKFPKTGENLESVEKEVMELWHLLK